MSVPILEVCGLRAAYGRIEVLRGVDLAIPKGAVVALLGPNGAGKSTLLKVISGQMAPTEGDIHLAGVHVHEPEPEKLARLGLCTIPQGRSVFPNLTVEENLTLVSYAGVPADAVLETAFAYFPKLEQRRKQLAGTMSGGEQQLLAPTRALASDPAQLAPDELPMGLRPRAAAARRAVDGTRTAHRRGAVRHRRADRRDRRLDPVHRAVRADRPAGLRLCRGDDRWSDRGDRRARRDQPDHVRGHPGRC